MSEAPPSPAGGRVPLALPPLPPDHFGPTQIDRFLGLQAQEVELRMQELRNAHLYSEQALRAQFEDREAEREHRRRERLIAYGFGAFIFVCLLGAMLLALLRQKEEFARELLKMLLFALPAGAGGYFAGVQRGKTRDTAEA